MRKYDGGDGSVTLGLDRPSYTICSYVMFYYNKKVHMKIDIKDNDSIGLTVVEIQIPFEKIKLYWRCASCGYNTVKSLNLTELPVCPNCNTNITPQYYYEKEFNYGWKRYSSCLRKSWRTIQSRQNCKNLCYVWVQECLRFVCTFLYGLEMR